ncbi:hypothetical protein FO519_000014 [Halicephalobus sp. NKZ332]|nr:hypothetical protein FO519_000014 [Halicephalobus sp. NKZ332]
MKQVLGFLLFLTLLVTVVAECEKDVDCESGEHCESETGGCELKTTPVPKRHGRKVEMCLHDGQCPARSRCVVLFCVYVGPDEIPQRHDDPTTLINEALKNITASE